MPVEVVRGTQPGKSSAGVPGDEDRVRLRVSVLLSLREKDNSHGASASVDGSGWCSRPAAYVEYGERRRGR